jgi:hypothetical protein
MEKSEPGFVVKFFFLKGIGFKKIHRKLTAVLGSAAYSLTQIKEWRARLETGDLSYGDKYRFARPPHVLGKALFDVLEKFPFAIAGIIAQHFDQSMHITKEILQWELGLRRFSRRWIPHSLSNA